MNMHLRRALSGAGVALLAATLATTVAQAQLGKPTAEEITRSGNGPGPVPGGSPGNPQAAIPENVKASADPRDFSGAWRQQRGGGAGGGGGGAPGAGRGGAPAGGGGRGGGPPPDGAPAAPAGAGAAGAPPGAGAPAGALPDRILCLPTPGTTVGGDGPMLLVQTPEQITWAAEEMHVIRRIFLTGQPSAGFQPNFLGEAMGHWDGNTLVIETRGLKSLPAGAMMRERWTKSADGKSIEMQIANVDGAGAPLGAPRVQTVTWRPGEQVLEWMCEDYNDEWLPGGTDFTDQVGK